MNIVAFAKLQLYLTSYNFVNLGVGALPATSTPGLSSLSPLPLYVYKLSFLLGSLPFHFVSFSF